MAERIAALQQYQELKAKRTRFGRWLTDAMWVVYFSFILLVVFNKPLLATRCLCDPAHHGGDETVQKQRH